MKALKNLVLLCILIVAIAVASGHSIIPLPGQASVSLSSLEKSGSSFISSLSSHNPLALAASGSGSGHSVEGPPTISAAFINQVFAAAHSPAYDTGLALYDLSLKYGIDDAYALAFFKHESIFGTTGVARASLSLGNIRCSAGYTCLEGYRAYSTYQEGYEDWYKLIRTLYIGEWHLSTVEQIIPIYAPSRDHNDVPGYISAIIHAVKTWRAGEVRS